MTEQEEARTGLEFVEHKAFSTENISGWHHFTRPDLDRSDQTVPTEPAAWTSIDCPCSHSGGMPSEPCE